MCLMCLTLGCDIIDRFLGLLNRFLDLLRSDDDLYRLLLDLLIPGVFDANLRSMDRFRTFLILLAIELIGFDRLINQIYTLLG